MQIHFERRNIFAPPLVSGRLGQGQSLPPPPLFGLALANHMAALLVAVVLLPYLLWQTQNGARASSPSTIIAVTSAGLLYLYLPLRFAAQPEFNLVAQYFERDLTQPADLLWMVSGRMFGREMLAYPLLDWMGEIVKFVGELWLNYVGVGLLVGLVGIYPPVARSTERCACCWVRSSPCRYFFSAVMMCSTKGRCSTPPIWCGRFLSRPDVSVCWMPCPTRR